MSEFQVWPKIARVNNLKCYITEKIDGTNAQIFIGPDADFRAGSRTRWITPESDNYGFARWAYDNKKMLLRLGEGRHYGEWWGQGIQRRYGLSEKRFTLFNCARWSPEELAERGLSNLVSAVPMLATCSIADLGSTMAYVESKLRDEGSVAAPGFVQPEGFVVQIGGALRFKVTDVKPGEKGPTP